MTQQGLFKYFNLLNSYNHNWSQRTNKVKLLVLSPIVVTLLLIYLVFTLDVISKKPLQWGIKSNVPPKY